MGICEYLFGKSSEDKACKYLKENNFKVVERNFHSKFGEIDIIAYDEMGVLCFIEVKSSIKYDATFRLTPSKYAKILKTVDYYLLKNSLDSDFELSFLVINGNNISLIRNISL